MDERHLRALARIAAGTNYNEERLIEEFHTLPEGLKRAITTVDTANAIQEIAKKFLLHIDQMAALASETGLVLLGLTHPREFVKNLARRLRISETRALEIAREVSEQILGKVREALRTLHESSENTKHQTPRLPIGGQANTKQIQNSNVKTEKTTPPQPSPPGTPSPRGLGTSPLKRGSGGGGAAESAKKLGVLEEQKEEPPLNPFLRKGGEGILQTPYSPSAKWNLGVPNNQSPRNNNQTDEEKDLMREEVMREIERPTATTPPSAPLLKKGGEGVVGPTGWRPPARNGNTQYPIPNTQTKSNIQSPTSPKPTTPPSIPPLGKGEEGNIGFLEQKLAGPTGAAHTEKRYTIDPYREPLA